MSKKEMTFGDRMKQYENAFKLTMPIRLPVAIRLDGIAFHTFTRGLDKPFDKEMHDAMVHATVAVCERAQNAVLGYTQSDEISVLLIDYKTLNTQAWLGNHVQKIISHSASRATLAFTRYAWENNVDKLKGETIFDSRVWVLPKDEVANYFIWRQTSDCARNSVSGLAQAHFSQKQLYRKKRDDMIKMVKDEKGIDWNELEHWKKYGTVVVKEQFEVENPMDPDGSKVLRSKWVEKEVVVVENRDFVNNFVNIS